MTDIYLIVCQKIDFFGALLSTKIWQFDYSEKGAACFFFVFLINPTMQLPRRTQKKCFSYALIFSKRYFQTRRISDCRLSKRMAVLFIYFHWIYWWPGSLHKCGQLNEAEVSQTGKYLKISTWKSFTDWWSFLKSSKHSWFQICKYHFCIIVALCDGSQQRNPASDTTP